MPPEAVPVGGIEPPVAGSLTARVRAIAAKGLGLFGILGFFLSWEVATRTHILNPFYFPPFTQIIAKGIELFASGTIWEHMIFSLTNFSVGFFVAVVVGVLAGVPMGWYRGVSRTLDPLLSGIYATPLIALLPLIIMLFGLGSISKIIMTFLAAIFPILINTMAGIANTDSRLITMSRSFGATDSAIFIKVSVPGSLPYIVAGMRVALGRALVYIVVAEQYGAAMGLGYLSSVAAQRFQMAAMFVPIVIIACLGAGLTELLKGIERRLEKWKPPK
ncbi:MAG: ABC transporter permease [Deltaproteobacteria bacterium]|nr:MAG: ABC transporter permease [Deltaproteobacteria bacterium]